MADVSTLVEVAAAYQDEERPEVREGAWAPASILDADFCLRRLGECQSELAEVDELEAEAIRQVRERTAKLRKIAERGVSFFTSVLDVWMAAEKPNLLKGTRKSKALVFGTVGWRSSPERLAVEDEAAFQAWVDALPPTSPLVRVKKAPDMKAIQEHFQETGEIPAGLKIQPAEDRPYIKPEPEGLKKGKR